MSTAARTADRSDATCDLRTFASAGHSELQQVRVEGGVPDDLAAQVARDALVLPVLWQFHARLGHLSPLSDHGMLVGLELAGPNPDPDRMWADAAAAQAAVRGAISECFPPDQAAKAARRAVAVRTDSSHGLATFATFAASPAGRTPTRVLAGTLEQDTISETVDLLAVASADATRLPTRMLVLATVRTADEISAPHPELPVLRELAADPGLAIDLPRGTSPPPWLEVESWRADLAYLQGRRAIPPVGTVRDLAAVLIAHQARFGPYTSLTDTAVRLREPLSYLWDCVVDLFRGEFLMLAAPDVASADRVVTAIRAADEDGAPVAAASIDAARRILRTQVLRRLASTRSALAAHAELQRSGLPAPLWASLATALRDVSHAEIDASVPGLLVTEPAFTLVVPAGRSSS